MMKIKVKANFSFTKLIDVVPDGLAKAMDHYADENMRRIKKGLEVGEDIHRKKFRLLSPETELIKREGRSDKMGVSKTPSKPLHHSGRMSKSLSTIKATDTNPVAINKSFSSYGHYHLMPRKIKKNAFTKYYKSEYRKELSGQIVPQRKWFGFHDLVVKNEQFAKKVARNFVKLLQNNFLK